jgi:hypothetical protein
MNDSTTAWGRFVKRTSWLLAKLRPQWITLSVADTSPEQVATRIAQGLARTNLPTHEERTQLRDAGFVRGSVTKNADTLSFRVQANRPGTWVGRLDNVLNTDRAAKPTLEGHIVQVGDSVSVRYRCIARAAALEVVLGAIAGALLLLAAALTALLAHGTKGTLVTAFLTFSFVALVGAAYTYQITDPARADQEYLEHWLHTTVG